MNSVPINDLLLRLKNVKQTGESRWVSQCPSHDDHTPSLAIRSVDDRLLLHCFAGCAVYEIVSSLGLELSDLFPRQFKTSDKPLRNPFPSTDILHCLYGEIVFLVVCAESLSKGHKLVDVDLSRLYLALERFTAAKQAGGLC